MLAKAWLMYKHHAMYLNFETQRQENGNALPPELVECERVLPNTVVSGIRIDGLEVALESDVAVRFANVVGAMNVERLPSGHFRDCCHFIMAMEGLWLPTSQPFDRRYLMNLDCFDEIEGLGHKGPVALGFPNDERCAGFGNARYVYGHSVYGVESSLGMLCLAKDGVEPAYSLSTFEDALLAREFEVARPIASLAIEVNGQPAASWRAK